LPEVLINFISPEKKTRRGDKARGDKAMGDRRREEFGILELVRYDLRSTIWGFEFGFWNLGLGI